MQHWKNTHCEAGKCQILTDRERTVKLASIEFAGYSTQGSVALAKLTDGTYVLVWEGGGDWMVFVDGQEHDREALNGWEPDAIREATSEARRICPDSSDDMEWFDDWAQSAEKTLGT